MASTGVTPTPALSRHDRPAVVRVEREGAAGRADLEQITHGHAVVEEGTRQPTGFALDRDAVAASVGRCGQRVGAQQRRWCRCGLELEGEELAGEEAG